MGGRDGTRCAPRRRSRPPPCGQSDAEETRRHVAKAGRRCLLLPGDVTEAVFCRDAVTRTVRELGALDILVDNAAHQRDKGTLEEIDDAEWNRTFRTNIHAYFHTGSEPGIVGRETLLDYSATTGAIHAFTKALAQNLVERGIRVSCVAPGPVWTALDP